MYHLMDHSSYAGLNITMHSLRMGGATLRHAQGTDIKDIMQIGRWSDITVNSYIRPELLLPQDILWKNPDYHTRRTQRHHYLCLDDCSIQSKDWQKAKQAYNRKQQKDLIGLPDKTRMQIIESRLLRQKRTIPKQMMTIHKVLKGTYACPPMTTDGRMGEQFLEDENDGNQKWFNLTVNIAAKRWKAFHGECRYKNGLTKKYPLPLKLEGRRCIPNTAYIEDEDKERAKDLLEEYVIFSKNVPENIKEEWATVKPLKNPFKALPLNIYLSEVEMRTESLYAMGMKMKALELLKQDAEEQMRNRKCDCTTNAEHSSHL